MTAVETFCASILGDPASIPGSITPNDFPSGV